MRLYLSIFSVVISNVLFSQEKVKEQFVSESFFHFKLGTTLNLKNENLYSELNTLENNSNSFSTAKTISFNPMFEMAFERKMARHFGLTLNLGFTQTRQHYKYHNTTGANATNPANYPKEGLILSNIPNFSLMPTFYIKNTRLMVGTGLYKYYYSFKPMDVGTIHFNLNLEGIMIYNRVSVMQSFEIGSYNLSVTGSYFGFFRKFDSGFQLALGLVI